MGPLLPSYKVKNTLERLLLRGVIGKVRGQVFQDTNMIGSTLELKTEEWASG